MPKELLTNIKSTITKAIGDIVSSDSEINSVVTLYDWRKNAFNYIFIGNSAILKDSINNYDFLILEVCAWNDTELFINPACIPKPLLDQKKETPSINFKAYTLDIFHDNINHKRIGIHFITDTQIMVDSGINQGTPYAMGIRNIYGVKIKTPSLSKYNTEETPVGIWINSKTIYRTVIDLGLLTISPSDTKIKKPCSIQNIDTITNFYCFAENKTSHQVYPLPYKYGQNSTYMCYENGDIVIFNTLFEWTLCNFYCIMEYTKL